MIFTHNGSTGGTDIVAAMVSKLSNVSIGRTIIYVDMMIILSSILLPYDGDFEARIKYRIPIIVYGFIVTYVMAYVTDMVINTNLKSAFNYIHALTPIMMKQRSGSIINMTSIVGISGNAGQANYAASKAGMIGLTKSVAKELGSRGIRVNAIAPGFIATEMTGVLNEDTKKQWILNIPLRREGKVEDVANVAVFLASDLSSYVTGQVINCCGGLNM